MKRKTVSGIMLSLLFVGMLILTFNIQPVKAESSLPLISLNPSEYTAALGESFTINVTISNVGNETVGLAAIQFSLSYNTTILDAVTTYLTPISEDYLSDYFPIDPVNHTYHALCPINDTAGLIYWGAIVRDFYDPFVGSGALLTINFTATTMGFCDLDLHDTTLGWINPSTLDIGEYVLDTDYSVEDGSITVVPGYTLTIYSSPTGVTFTVDAISRSTPWSGTYAEGTSVSLVMPETHDGYVWSHWLEDGDTNRIKTVTLDTNITLTAVYTPPKPVGGKATPINIPMNKPGTPALWIWLSTIILSLVLTVVYVKKRKR